MTAKEYLSQARRVDRMVEVKLEEAARLRALATKATATLSDMPSGATRNVHSMEDIIIKLVELEYEVSEDIDKMLTMKKEIYTAIKSVANANHRMLLELRYLAFKPWTTIASILNYSKDYIFDLHQAALSAINVPSESETSQ